MTTVLVALIPCVVMAMYNTGLQANTAMAEVMGDHGRPPGWRGDVLAVLGVGYDPDSILGNLLHGALYFLPVYIVMHDRGGILGSALLRGPQARGQRRVLRHRAAVPADAARRRFRSGRWPWASLSAWWSAKEIFGGTGRNFLNPALTARAFLFFAYPAADLRRRQVWTAVDGFSGADAAGRRWRSRTGMAGGDRSQVTWCDAFLGTIPGSMGETSTLACLIGAAILLVCRRRLLADHGRACCSGRMALAALLYGGRQRRPTRCSTCRPTGTWCSAASPSGWSSWRPTRSAPR